MRAQLLLHDKEIDCVLSPSLSTSVFQHLAKRRCWFHENIFLSKTAAPVAKKGKTGHWFHYLQ
jgi:hypothetical protein